RAVSAALGILGGDNRRPTVSYCLSQFLEDKARGRDVTKKDWLNYERERKRITGEFIKLVGVNKEINNLSKQDAREFQKKPEVGGYARASVRKQIKFMRTLTEFALRELELEGRNPFTGLKIVAPVDDDDSGVSFEYAEVKTLLNKTGTINDELQDIVRILA